MVFNLSQKLSGENVQRFFAKEMATLKLTSIFIGLLCLFFYCIAQPMNLLTQAYIGLLIPTSSIYCLLGISAYLSKSVEKKLEKILLFLGLPLFSLLIAYIYVEHFSKISAYTIFFTIILYANIFFKKKYVQIHLIYHISCLLFLTIYSYNSHPMGVHPMEYSLIVLSLSTIVFYRCQNKIDQLNFLLMEKDFLTSVLNDTIGAFLVYDTKQKKITDCNKYCVDLLEAKNQAQILFIDKNDFEWIRFLDKQLIAIKSELQLKESWQKESQVLCLSGKRKWLQLIITKTKSFSNLLLIRLVDISERKRAERATRFTQFTINQASDLLFWVKKNGQIIYANHAATKKLGYTQKNLLHMSIYDIDVHPKHKASSKHKFWEKLKDSKFITEESLYKSSDGQIIPMEVSANYLYFEQQEFNCIFARDISERKLVMQKLRESEERFRKIFEHAPLGMVLVDLTHKVLQTNRSLTQMLEYEQGELVGKRVDEFTHPEDRFTENSLVKRINEGEHVSNHKVEKRYLKKDGEIVWIALTSTMLYDGQGKKIHALGMIEDITYRKKDQQALRKYADKLERSNKELEQFAYVVSHDLQEPLRMVSSYLQLLERRYKDELDDVAIEFIAFAVDGAQRMTRLIQDLLQYSRVNTKTQPPEAINCNDLIINVLKDLESSITEAQAEIKHKSLPVVVADRRQLGQVFQNLIGNAIKYRSEELPRVQISAQTKENEWIFQIQDNGIGIEEPYQEKIFGVFQRLHTRNEYQGTGIGLAICQRIVYRHGGKIWVESKAGEGANFYFTLPIVKKEAETQIT